MVISSTKCDEPRFFVATSIVAVQVAHKGGQVVHATVEGAEEVKTNKRPNRLMKVVRK